MLKRISLFLMVFVVSSFAANIEIKDAYVRATPPGLPNSATFLTIVNNSNKDISLVKVTSNIAKNVELHTHDMKNGIMKMYQVPKIDVKANAQTVLKPGGYHVMLIGLNKALKVGQEVEFTFIFSNDDKVSVTAPIKTVMGGMMKKHSKMKTMSCGSGKCGSGMKKSEKKSMSCGSGKCGAGMKKK